jgi:hypothetical protein
MLARHFGGKRWIMTPADAFDPGAAARHAVPARVAGVLAGDLYYPCVLLVHPVIATLRQAQVEITAHLHCPNISVGGFLCAVLSEAPIDSWQRTAQKSFLEEMRCRSPGPVVCADIDLLCEPGLGLDPLRVLREGSRHTPIVVMWPGEYKDRVLSYAVPEHAHYRVWRQTGLCGGCIIPLP